MIKCQYLLHQIFKERNAIDRDSSLLLVFQLLQKQGIELTVQEKVVDVQPTEKQVTDLDTQLKWLVTDL